MVVVGGGGSMFQEVGVCMGFQRGAGDRPSRLLALKLKECKSKASIDIIKNASGEITTDPKAVNDEFRSFYSTLYLSEVSLDRGEM